jgi:hypothetical protein
LGHEQRLVAADGRPAKIAARGPAKQIIYLHMGGGVSQVDSFDRKPLLEKLAGKDVPADVAARVPKTNKRLRLNNLYASPYKFSRYGECDLEASELFAHSAAHADKLCLIRSMRHDSPIHTPADYLTLTGSLTGTRPSLGAWIAYGLGSENENLPGYIAMVTGENFSGPALHSAGFLPAQFQATLVDAKRGIPNIRLPEAMPRDERRRQLDLIAALNRRHLEQLQGQSELDARIASYELAFRMQTAAPETFDLKSETAETHALYGLDDEKAAPFGRNCLLARRLVERGVRFIQLIQGGWDAHGDLKGNHTSQARLVDKPIAGLLTDLARRGLLASTLLIWGGEFGRTPTAEGGGDKPGRDHNPAGYCLWLAGAGVKGGQTIGATDELGYTATERPIHPNDLQATMLAAIGIEQHELYYEHQNRREILTFNGGKVVKEALA